MYNIVIIASHVFHNSNSDPLADILDSRARVLVPQLAMHMHDKQCPVPVPIHNH